MGNPLKYRELIKRLRPYGIIEEKKRGKGSHVLLRRSGRGPVYTLPHHNDNADVLEVYIKAICRRFDIRLSEILPRK